MTIKYDYIIDRIKLILGAPIVELVDSDETSIPKAIEVAQKSYWISFPYIFRSTFETTSDTQSPYKIPFATIKNAAFSGADLDETTKQQLIDSSYILGIVRIEASDSLTFTPSYNAIDAWLLGSNSVNSNSINSDFDTSYKKSIINKSRVRQVNGSTDFQLDQVLKTINFYLPPSASKYTVDYSLGFQYEQSLDFIEERRLDIFTKMCAREFLEMVLSSRSAVSVNGDYNISTNFIESKLRSLTEDLDNEIPKSTIQPLFWG